MKIPLLKKGSHSRLVSALKRTIPPHKTNRNKQTKKNCYKNKTYKLTKKSKPKPALHALSVDVVTLIFDLPVRSDIQRKGNL